MKRNASVLQVLHKCKPSVVKAVLKGASPDLIKALCECSLNILKGRIKLSPTQKKKLSRHKNNLRLLATKKTTLKQRKRVLQKGGFLGALLGPVLGVLGSLFGNGAR